MSFAKKRFGQHFLIDEFIINQIVQAIHPTDEDHLVEIGPGRGAITLPLLPLVAKLDAIELDRDMIPILTKKLAGKGCFVIHALDALTVDLATLTQKPTSLRLVGNLPYNISTPLIFHLLSQKEFIIDMHFMLQKEVGLRLTAHPGCKRYGRLSVMAQYHCDIEALIDVPPHAFKPIPKVDSLFIRLQPHEPREKAHCLNTLNHLVKTAFAQRRKTIHNALKTLLSTADLEANAINPNSRAEELTVEKFVILSNSLAKKKDFK